MAPRTPEDLLLAWFDAFNRGDLGALLRLYEPHASLIAEPEKVVSGRAAVGEELQRLLALKPALRLERFHAVVAGDVALSLARWSLTGADAEGRKVEMNGTSAGIQRRQADGGWLYALDNPWGSGILCQ